MDDGLSGSGTALRILIPVNLVVALLILTGEAGARNGRKSLTGAPGAEGRVLQWSCHKWSS